jgi:hypothetical protein
MHDTEEGAFRARLNRLRRDGGWEQRTPVEEGFWLNP